MAITTFDSGNMGPNISLSNANLTATKATAVGAAWSLVLSTTGKTTGKLYAELLIVTVADSGSNEQIGFCKNDQTLNSFIGATGNDGWERVDMTSFDGGAEGVVTYTTANRGFTSMVANDVWNLAIDFDAGKAWTGKNNSYGGSPSAGTNPAFTWAAGGTWYIVFAANTNNGANTAVVTLHADNSNQTYLPPSGFSPWDPIWFQMGPEDGRDISTIIRPKTEVIGY